MRKVPLALFAVVVVIAAFFAGSARASGRTRIVTIHTGQTLVVNCRAARHRRRPSPSPTPSLLPLPT